MISKEQETVLFKKLNETEAKCPICGNQGFSIVPDVFELKNIKEDSEFNRTLNVIPMECTSCSYLYFFNAKKALK